MKRIFTWAAIAALLMINDGFEQDQTDTSVSLLGEHMDAINNALVANAAKVTELDQKLTELDARAVAAEAALVAAAADAKAAKDELSALKVTHEAKLAELAAANVKMSQRPVTETKIITDGPGADKKIAANEMDFQKALVASLKQYGTVPSKTA